MTHPEQQEAQSLREQHTTYKGRALSEIVAERDELAEALNLLLYGTDCELDSEGRSVFRFTQKTLATARLSLSKVTK